MQKNVLIYVLEAEIDTHHIKINNSIIRENTSIIIGVFIIASYKSIYIIDIAICKREKKYNDEIRCLFWH